MNTNSRNSLLMCDLSAGETGAQGQVNVQFISAAGVTIQTDLGGGGAVSYTFECRVEPSAPWVAIGAAISVAGIVTRAPATPEMRLNIASNTATRLRVWVMG